MTAKQNLETQQSSFIIGTDAFLGLEKWYASKELLEGFSFIVGTRPGYKERELKLLISRLKKEYGAKITEINNSEVEISSTGIKALIKRGKSIKYLLPESVEEYIYKHNLYTDVNE